VSPEREDAGLQASGERGRLIALEGIDGSGKSTQTALLARRLDALATWEPGATALGRELRRLTLSPGRDDAPVPRAEALLMVADRAQHVVEVISPALEAGRWVVTDRYTGSTLAYQGWGRGLQLDGLRQLARWACAGVEADLSVLIDVPVEVARARLRAAAPDRLESLDLEFHARVREGFVSVARDDPDGWAVVDGSASPEEVAETVAEAVRSRWGRP
jgi:dTMP kinase